MPAALAASETSLSACRVPRSGASATGLPFGRLERAEPRTRSGCPDVRARQTGAMLNAYGAAAVTFMVVMYALERRGPRYVLGFAAVACSPASTASVPGPGRSESSR